MRYVAAHLPGQHDQSTHGNRYNHVNGVKLSRLPTKLRGYVDDPTWEGILADVLEHIPDLAWPTSVRTYLQMRTDPKLAAVLDGYKLQLRRAQWQLDPTDCRPEVVDLVADDLGLPVKGRDRHGSARTRGVSWHEHLRLALTMLDFGHAGFEMQVQVIDGKARLVGLWERPQHTISQIHVDPITGAFRGISQELDVGRWDEPEQPADRLVWYAHNPEGSGWHGRSMLRPAYAPWLLKREMQRVLATASRRFGMGVPVAEFAPTATPTPQQFSEAQKAAAAARVGDQAGLAMPPGAVLKLVGLSGGVPDTLGFLKWLDQQMSTSVLMGHLDLGQTQTGNRALGSVFIDNLMLALETVGEYICDVVTRQICARLVLWNWGPDEPVPRLVVSGVGTRREITAETLQLLIQSGALSADPELEEWVRREYRLPPASGERRLPPTPGAGGGGGAAGPQPEPEPGPQPGPDGGQAADASIPERGEGQQVAAAAEDQPVDDPADQEPAEIPPSGDQPTGEQQGGVDPQAIDEEHTAALAALLAGWPLLAAPLVAGLAGTAGASAAAGGVASLTELVVPGHVTRSIAGAITDALVALARTSAVRARAELAAQGIEVDVADVDVDLLRDLAEATAEVLVGGYRSAAARTAMTHAGAPAGDVTRAVQDHLDGLSETAARQANADRPRGWVANELASVLHTAQHHGRVATFRLLEQLGVPVEWRASEVNDRNTCAPCRAIHGTVFPSLAEALAAYPAGKYVGCLGRQRCRGLLYAVVVRDVLAAANVPGADEDADIADLLWALAYVAGELVDGEVEARKPWNPDLHPRWPAGTPGGKGGQFRERLAFAIETWLAGDRSKDPLESFTDDQLRRTARRRGVQVGSSATRDEISRALLESVLPARELRRLRGGDRRGRGGRSGGQGGAGGAAGRTSTERPDADERLGPDGDGALAQVPADRVGADDRPGAGDVLPEPRGGDREADTAPDRATGGPGAGGSAVRGPAGEDEGGQADSGAGRAGGDAPEGGGRRDTAGRAAVGGVGQVAGRDADRMVGATSVFRPRSQGDLAPSTRVQRLEANLEALRILRRLQEEGRPATPAEQAKLARWSGWGSLPDVFKEPPPKGRYARAQEELKELLSPEEYRAARRTTRNAHYTDAGLVDAIWDAVRDLGFTGGEVLEPGSGSGTFMGMVPDDVAPNTHVTGVELDPITGAIAQALYPNQDVRIESFADTRTPDGSFDLAIGNVPFSDTKLFDPVYNPGRKHSMHNHFIIKSLRMTRPGGLVALITSRYTMDSLSPEARREMAELGDLVGAVRLPSGAHQRAAGTDVVTDLLIFRRREPGAPYSGLPFLESRKVTIDGRETSVNEFFLDNPDMVLGTMHMTSGLKDAFEVRGDRDAAPALREALAKVVTRAQGMGQTMTPGRSQRPVFTNTDQRRVPEGFLRAKSNGRFTRVVDGVETPYEVPSTQRHELRQLLRLRDTAMKLVDAEAASAEDTEEIKRLREDLNEIYDRYVARYGPINRFTERRTGRGGDADDDDERVTRIRPPQGGFRNDPFSAIVQALEIYDPVTGTARKADIFHRRTISPRTPRDRADSPADALAITLDQVGQVDLGRIAELLDTDEATARERLGTLVFDEPGTGRLVSRAEYLSGNVREKLEAARLAAAEDPRFAVNVEELEKVLPPDLTPDEINARMGAGWIEPRYVEQFLREILRDPSVRVERVHGNQWRVEGQKRSQAATTEWGLRELNAIKLAELILEQKPIRVTNVDGDLDQDRTELAQAKAREMADRFAEWLWEDPDRARELAAEYNRRFNSLVLRQYDTSPMELPGLNKDGFYGFPHRYAAIRRIINEPSVGLWHEVGAGKTTTMIIAGMEMRRLGLVQKPAYVVPNHMLEQFTREFLERYPQARVLAIGADDLKNDPGGEKRRQIIAQAATGDWDAVILTQGAFKRIPVSTETEREYLQAEVEPLRRALARRRSEVAREIRARAEAEGWSQEVTERRVEEAQRDDRSVKDLEGLIEKAEQRIKEQLGETARDPGLTFEATGIDYLFVDEAHGYKNLRTASAIPGMGHPGSQIATDLHMKLHYLRSRYDRVATLATATPIANSVAEAYTMMRYTRPDLLQEMGIETFDEFAATFGEMVTRLEVAPTGGLRTHSRFAKFVNLPEFLRAWLIASDVRTAEDLQDIVKTPDLVERVDEDGRRTRTPETVVVPPSQELLDFMQELVTRAQHLPRRPEKGGDNMLKITGEGRAAALDLRMVGRETNERTKLDVAADRIAEIYHRNKDRVYTDKTGHPVGEPGALQLVFSDIGTPSGDGDRRRGTNEGEAQSGLARFNAYEALRDKLVERGIPRNKIRFIHEAQTDKDKAELFAAARDGRVAVLIGSTGKMGVGTNVQHRAVALHHLDAPWRPADVQQREGRIIRQGNHNPEVEVIRYVTEQSFDSYIWQAIATKSRFINQVMRGRLDVREIDDVGEFTLTAQEVTALGTGNRYLIEHADALADLTRLQRAKRNHDADQRNLARMIEQTGAEIARTEQAIAQLDQAIARRQPSGRFRITVGGRELRDRGEALDELRRQIRSAGDTPKVIGEFRGFTLRAQRTASGYTVELEGVPDVLDIRRGNLRSEDVIGGLQNILSRLERTRTRRQARLEQARQDVEALRRRLGRPFRDEEALRQAQERFERVDRLLREELERRGETPQPTDPAERAAARRTATINAIRERLDSGQGFESLGQLTTWLEADEQLARFIPEGAGAKWGYLTPGGQLLVVKGSGRGWNIVVPRRMMIAMSGFRTQKEARQLAEAMERELRIPWNEDVDLREWRAPDGATASELVAELRARVGPDPDGYYKMVAADARVRRRVPQRLHDALLAGGYRSDGLGLSNFRLVPDEAQERILSILEDLDDTNDLQVAARLREFGMDQDDYRAQSWALAAASQVEFQYRQRVPQRLDGIRRRFAFDFAQVRSRSREVARIEEILAEADQSRDLDTAAVRLRDLAQELRNEAEATYGPMFMSRVATLAGNLADALEVEARRERESNTPGVPQAPDGGLPDLATIPEWALERAREMANGSRFQPAPEEARRARQLDLEWEQQQLAEPGLTQREREARLRNHPRHLERWIRNKALEIATGQQAAA